MYRNTKIGDKFWSPQLGNCQVIEIRSGAEERQRCVGGDFICKSEVDGSICWYMWDGKRFVTDVERSLYHRDEITINPAAAPATDDDMDFML